MRDRNTVPADEDDIDIGYLAPTSSPAPEPGADAALPPEALEAEAGRLLVASARARRERMGPDDAHELRHLLACVNAGNSDPCDGGRDCHLDRAALARPTPEPLDVWESDELLRFIALTIHESKDSLYRPCGRVGHHFGSDRCAAMSMARVRLARRDTARLTTEDPDIDPDGAK